MSHHNIDLKSTVTIFSYFFPALFMSQKIIAITRTTPITPTQTPALKMLSIAWQLISEIAIRSIKNNAVFKLNLVIKIDLIDKYSLPIILTFGLSQFL